MEEEAEAQIRFFLLVTFLLSVGNCAGLILWVLHVRKKFHEARKARVSEWAKEVTAELNKTLSTLTSFMTFAEITREDSMCCLPVGQDILDWFKEHLKTVKTSDADQRTMYLLYKACDGFETLAGVFEREERDEEFLRREGRWLVFQLFLCLAPAVAFRNNPSVRGIRDACIVIQKNFPKVNKILEEMVELNLANLFKKDRDLLDQAFRADSSDSAFLPIRCFAFQKWYLSTKSPAEARFEYQC